MIRKTIILRFSPGLLEQTVIDQLITEHGLLVNILQADKKPEKAGRLMIELSGDEEKLCFALEWLKEQGLGVFNDDQQIIWREDRCTHCGACTVLCPGKALVFQRPEMTLQFEKDKCVTCEFCLRACPARAMAKLFESAHSQ